MENDAYPTNQERDMANSQSTAEPDANLGAPVGDKAAYLEAAQQRLPNFQPTIDATDVNIGATIHTDEGLVSHPASANQPGQVFAPWQLPHPSAAIQAGLPVISVPEHLIVDHDDAAAHLQGPEPQDYATRDLREKLGYPMLATSTGVVTPPEFDEAVESARGRVDEESGQRIDPIVDERAEEQEKMEDGAKS